MGRNRKPSDLQTGNLTVLQQDQRKREEARATTSKHKLLAPRALPDGLVDEIAVNEYKRVRKLLKEIDVICDLDLYNLVAYCNAYSGLRKVTEQMHDQPYVLEKETQYGTTYYKNPLLNVQKDYSDEMLKFAKQCGMTIDSRLKAASLKTTKEEDVIETRFGAI